MKLTHTFWFREGKMAILVKRLRLSITDLSGNPKGTVEKTSKDINRNDDIKNFLFRLIITLCSDYSPFKRPRLFALCLVRDNNNFLFGICNC